MNELDLKPSWLKWEPREPRILLDEDNPVNGIKKKRKRGRSRRAKVKRVSKYSKK